MKYIANPVEVDAFKIIDIHALDTQDYELTLEGINEKFITTAAMTARMTPTLGDYLVIQSDGYVYLNPADVFKRKYSPLVEN